MNRAALESKLRTVGFALSRQESVDGPYWIIRSLSCERRWTCKNLKEVKSLFLAIKDRAERGGTIEFDGGDAWVVV